MAMLVYQRVLNQNQCFLSSFSESSGSNSGTDVLASGPPPSTSEPVPCPSSSWLLSPHRWKARTNRYANGQLKARTNENEPWLNKWTGFGLRSSNLAEVTVEFLNVEGLVKLAGLISSSNLAQRHATHERLLI